MNINVAAVAAKCLTRLAEALQKNFPNSVNVAAAIFEKFKEKKPTLLNELIVCIDAVYLGTVSFLAFSSSIL